MREEAELSSLQVYNVSNRPVDASTFRGDGLPNQTPFRVGKDDNIHTVEGDKLEDLQRFPLF
jgi:hypothetical protein